MEIIPLVHLNKRKIEEIGVSWQSFKELLGQVDSDNIYFLDKDGIEKDKPNLCLYQRVSEHKQIWVDAGPRELGDVVDAVMAGAINITIRRDLWPKFDVSAVKEITENEIYVNIDLDAKDEQNRDLSFYHNVDGAVVFIKKKYTKADFKFESILKNVCSKYKIYVYESDPKNVSYWKGLGVRGFLVDFQKIREFKSYGF